MSVSGQTVHRERAKPRLLAARLGLRVDSACEAALGAWERFASHLGDARTRAVAGRCCSPADQSQVCGLSPRAPPRASSAFPGQIFRALDLDVVPTAAPSCVAFEARYWVWTQTQTWTCALDGIHMH